MSKKDRGRRYKGEDNGEKRHEGGEKKRKRERKGRKKRLEGRKRGRTFEISAV